MSRWRFNLRQSRNLALIGELTDASGRSLTLAHNTPGAANWDYPMSGQYAAAINPFNTCISAERYNWRATKLMNDGGTPGEKWDWIWSGFVMPIDEDWTTDKMKVSCVGWAERFKMRLLHRDKSWPNKDDIFIFEDIVAEANLTAFPDGSAYPVPVVAGSAPATPTWMEWGGPLPNEGIGGLTPYLPRTNITVTKTKNQYMYPVFDELTNIENGADWWVHPETRKFYVFRKRAARRDGVKYPAVIVAFRWGPNNLAQFSRNIAADQKANFALVTGASGVQPGAMWNVTDQATNGLIETLTQWTDCTSTDVLVAEAGAQIIMREHGKITYGITPFHYAGGIGLPPTSVPEPFVDYNPVGDEFMLKATHKVRGDIPLGLVRSFGVSISIDEESNEQLGQLQVAP